MQSFSFSLNIKPTGADIFMPLKKERSGGIFSFTRPHLFHVLTEEGVAAMFLRTVASDVESARAFVSKNSAVDLDAIQHILELENTSTKIIGLQKATESSLKNTIKRARTRSILLQNCILHLHMIEEPDQFGPWKIYGVDKEPR